MATQFKKKVSQRTQMGKASQAYKSVIGVKGLVLIPPEVAEVDFNSIQDNAATTNLGSMTLTDAQVWPLDPLPATLEASVIMNRQTGWTWRKKITVGAAADAGTNYQVKITVHYGSGVDSGSDIYCNSHCKTDFGDVRFAAADGTTLLDYWIESETDGDNAVFWVEVKADLSIEDQTICLVYGKADATTTSNGVNTFIQYHGYANAGFQDANVACGTNFRFKASARPTTTLHNFLVRVCEAVGSNTFISTSSYSNGDEVYFYTWKAGVYTELHEPPAVSTTVFHIWEILYNTTAAHGYVDNNEISTGSTTNLPNVDMGLCLYIPTGNGEQNWSFIAKYVSPEPTILASSAEEQGAFYLETHDFTLTFNAPTGYVFDSWTTSGLVSAADPTSATTTLTVTGTGTVTAVYKELTCQVLIVVLLDGVSNPTHMVRIDGVNYHDGDTVTLPPGDHNLTWASGDGVVFYSWGVSGNLAVADPNSETTTLTATCGGTLTLNVLSIEQITNGGFEDDLNNWIQEKDDPCGIKENVTINTSAPYEGTKAAQIPSNDQARLRYNMGRYFDDSMIYNWVIYARSVGASATIDIDIINSDGSLTWWTESLTSTYKKIDLKAHIEPGKLVAAFRFWSEDAALLVDGCSFTLG